jgi:hypothetical protein
MQPANKGLPTKGTTACGQNRCGPAYRRVRQFNCFASEYRSHARSALLGDLTLLRSQASGILIVHSPGRVPISSNVKTRNTRFVFGARPFCPGLVDHDPRLKGECFRGAGGEASRIGSSIIFPIR